VWVLVGTAHCPLGSILGLDMCCYVLLLWRLGLADSFGS
jgi:hypothetical protein